MKEKALTWAQYHPDVAEAFTTFTPWPAELIETDHATFSQPSVAIGPEDEMVVNAWPCDDGTKAAVYHSIDRGATWSKLCDVPLAFEIPSGFKQMTVHTNGVGFLQHGTILLSYSVPYNDGRPYAGYEDESLHYQTFVIRTTDRGATWQDPFELDASPWMNVAGMGRMTQAPGGAALWHFYCENQPRPGKPLPKSEWKVTGRVYASSDSGKTWAPLGETGDHWDETDLLPLDENRVLAVTRYQRKKLPSDPEELATAYYFDAEHRQSKPDCQECAIGATTVGGHSVYKQSAIGVTEDGGRTWTRAHLATGWLQQTACLVRLSDGTVVIPFSHKDAGQGQRFMVSYDDGATWSRTVYELHKGGMYASSVVLSDDTIVTVHATGRNMGGRGTLDVLRWKVPPKKEVEKGGFFTPRPVDETPD